MRNRKKETLNKKIVESVCKSLKRDLIENVVFSGGEPFLKNNFENLVLSAAKFFPVQIVTNGILLRKKFERIQKVRPKIVMSIPSLEEKNYKFITGENFLNDALHSAYYCSSLSLPLRINVVLVKGINDTYEDFMKFLALARKLNANLTFVEMFNTKHDFFKKYFSPIERFEKTVRKETKFLKTLKWGINVYEKNGISIACMKCPCSANICEKCLELRDIYITPDGKYKPYFCKNTEFDEIILP
jgi:cyclic pyranopterin phosphate synthase